MFDSGHYDWSLFIWHLVLEKIVKAKIAKLGKKVLWTHNLTLLCEKAEIKLNEAEFAELSEIKTFNIEARYDNYKFDFYKKATKYYTEKWIQICEQFYKKVKKDL